MLKRINHATNFWICNCKRPFAFFCLTSGFWSVHAAFSIVLAFFGIWHFFVCYFGIFAFFNEVWRFFFFAFWHCYELWRFLCILHFFTQLTSCWRFGILKNFADFIAFWFLWHFDDFLAFWHAWACLYLCWNGWRAQSFCLREHEMLCASKAMRSTFILLTDISVWAARRDVKPGVTK